MGLRTRRHTTLVLVSRRRHHHEIDSCPGSSFAQATPRRRPNVVGQGYQWGMVAGISSIKVGQRTASVPKQGGVESLSTTEKASGQRLLSTEKRIDAKQFHLLCTNAITQARATSGRAQTSRAWKTRGRAGRNTRSRVLSSR